MENLAPLTSDPLKQKAGLEIIRGLDKVIREDIEVVSGELFAEGDWAVINNDYQLAAPGVTAVANTVPVWAGNAEGRTDVHATGKLTVLRRTQGFIYKTENYDKTQSYNVGDNLTVKNLGGGEKYPTKAAGADVVLARVNKVLGGMLEIEVLSN